MKQNQPRRPRKWSAYETGKGCIAQSVTRSCKDGKDAAKMYERKVKRLSDRLGV